MRLRLSLLVLLTLTGCAAIGNEKLTDAAVLDQIKVGTTSQEQVEALLGEPAKRMNTRLSGFTYEWWLYTYQASTINPLDYLLLYGVFFNGFGTPDTRYDLAVFFDHDGRVNSVTLQTTSYDMGTPMTAMRVTSAAGTTLSVAGLGGPAMRFEDRMETAY